MYIACIDDEIVQQQQQQSKIVWKTFNVNSISHNGDDDGVGNNNLFWIGIFHFTKINVHQPQQQRQTW